MDGWHFPRPELAEHYLSLLDLGISSSLAIIAPRRKGKTMFILGDLAPLAQKNKYVPVYASFWQNLNAPHEGLIQALEEAIEITGKRSAFSRLLNAKIKKTTIHNELLGKMEVEFADNPTKTNNKDLAYIDRLLKELENKAGKKTILLLIDEVQHLATSKIFDPLSYSLRTVLDKRQGKIKAIFTGSSRHYMNLLLNESQSPFYQYVETVPFPELDKRFINFLRKKMTDDHGMTVALQPLNKAFRNLDYSPYWMMKLVASMVTFKMGVKAAQDHILDLMEAAEGFEAVAKGLKPIDRIVFMTLCDGKNPFSRDLLARIDKETNVKGVPPNIQRSIQRLSEANLVSQIQKGKYYIEKPGLKHYLSKGTVSRK